MCRAASPSSSTAAGIMTSSLNKPVRNEPVSTATLPMQGVFLLEAPHSCRRGRVRDRHPHQNGGSAPFFANVAHAAKQHPVGIPAYLLQGVLRQIERALLRRPSALTRVDVGSCRTHMLPVAVPKAAPSTGERQARGPLESYFTRSARRRGSEQSQSDGRRYGVSTRLHGELDEDAFDVGLHGLGGNLQLLSDAFVGKSTAHRVQDAVFARTQ